MQKKETCANFVLATHFCFYLIYQSELGSNANDSEDVFDTEVWAWGKGKRGQQGQGDMLDRLQPLQISTLSGIGVVKICSGDKHSLAITITGLIFGWGENSKGQACPHFSLAVCSVPQVSHFQIFK